MFTSLCILLQLARYHLYEIICYQYVAFYKFNAILKE